MNRTVPNIPMILETLHNFGILFNAFLLPSPTLKVFFLGITGYREKKLTKKKLGFYINIY